MVDKKNQVFIFFESYNDSLLDSLRNKLFPTSEKIMLMGFFSYLPRSFAAAVVAPSGRIKKIMPDMLHVF